jgi:hypothetical protein
MQLTSYFFLLCKKLHDLPDKMTKLKFRVTEFNTYVQETMSNLNSGGGTSNDLLVYLFDSYKIVPDHAFHRWQYERKKEDYDDIHEEITPDALMLAAETKYNQITQEDTWEAKSKEEQQILALTTQLKTTTDKLAELSKSKSSNKVTNKTDSKKSKGSTRSTNIPLFSKFCASILGW